MPFDAVCHSASSFPRFVTWILLSALRILFLLGRFRANAFDTQHLPIGPFWLFQGLILFIGGY